MRRFIVNVLLALVPVALMAGVNYTRDPGGLFGGGLEARIATVLASGHAVRDPGDYNPRIVNRDLIRLVPRAPDVIVLGSSRAMHIRASAFPGRTMRNEAVFSATVEDFEATLGMHDAADAWPREMVLALDPWLLNEFHGLTGWRSVTAEYEYMSRRLGIDPSRGLPAMPPALDRYLALLSPAYFQVALRTRPDAGRPHRAVPAPDTEIDEVTLRSDSSRLGARAEREMSRADIERAALRDATPPLQGFEHFSRLAPKPERELELLTRFLLGHGVRVTYVLLPYHPLMKRVFDSNPAYGMVAQAEQRFRAIARRLGVPIFGDYDSAACGCSELDFSDGMHPDARCSQRALSAGPF